MKKSIVLLIALLSLVGCSNVDGSLNTKGGRKTTYCSCFEPNPTPVLDSFGLSNANKIDASFGELKSHQLLLDRTNDNYMLFDNYQSVTSFVSELEQKTEYDHYNETIKFLNAIKESQFEDKKLIITQQLELGSYGYSLHFDGAYLKEDTLYFHGFKFDKNSPGASNLSFTMDIAYMCGYMWLNKDVSFNEFKTIYDQDLRQPMVIELD